MQWVNPLHYPLAVLAGAIVLVGGVRFAKLPSVVVVPLAVAVATGGAMLRQTQQPKPLTLESAELTQQVLAVQKQARTLAEKTHAFRAEATRLLTNAAQMDLLVAVQYACDRAEELPTKIDQLVQRLQSRDALLSTSDLQQQLAEVEARLQNSSGAARTQLARLADGLQRNLQLVQQGQDARQAQVANLAMLVADTAGALQALQNRLSTANLADASQTVALRSLSDDLQQVQENVDLLISQ